ncbi:MAG TPA: hypothetical protein VFE02_11810 [Candidatus Acidoferrales bacterium]|jgi:hypothetical protein|nr:hypothetical protein [Candidatus Acidoferrales bacterium]
MTKRIGRVRNKAACVEMYMQPDSGRLTLTGRTRPRWVDTWSMNVAKIKWKYLMAGIWLG